VVIERGLLYLMYCGRIGIFTYARLGFRVSVKTNGRVEHGLVDSVRNARVVLRGFCHLNVIDHPHIIVESDLWRSEPVNHT